MDGLIEVRVAVGMAGARQGQIRWVNADDPYIARRLQLGYLQRTGNTMSDEPETTESEGPSEGNGAASAPAPEVVAADG